MGFRFRTSIRLAPGVRLNLSRSGVSTTLGRRGLSVNVSSRGRRTNARAPANGQATGGGGSLDRTGSDGAAGCLGCSAFGFLLLVLVGLCNSPDGPSPRRESESPPPLSTTERTSAPEPRETFYIHGPLNVRSGAGTSYGVVRTLSRGERVTLGPRDARGWAVLYDSYGGRIGYVYRASDNVRSYAPAPASAARVRPRAAPGHPSGATAICRDGTYSYSRNRRGTCSWHGGVAQWL